MAGLALSATVGCGFTAQIGAMRINEEIDALEVMGVPSLPFLVTTRIIAGFIAVIPLYVLGLLTSYFATRTHRHAGLRPVRRAPTTTTSTCSCHRRTCCGRSSRCCVFAVVIILTHCYYGYRASGGPAGVGLAVGRAVRFSIVAVNIIDLFLSLAIWGSTTTVRIAG